MTTILTLIAGAVFTLVLITVAFIVLAVIHVKKYGDPFDLDEEDDFI